MSMWSSARQFLSVNKRAVLMWGAVALAVEAVVAVDVMQIHAAVKSDPPPGDDFPDRAEEHQAHDLVALRAQEFVEAWLRANTTDPRSASRLQEYVTFPFNTSLLPALPSTAADPAAIAIPLERATDDGQRWAAVVRVDVKGFSAKEPERQTFQVPMFYLKAQARAQQAPALVDSPAIEYELEPDYPASVDSSSPAASRVTGFLQSYLTQSPGADVSLYTLPSAGFKRIGRPVKSVDKVTVAAQSTVADQPAPGAEAHVLAVASVKTITGAPLQLSYQLDLLEASGNWSVAALEDFPQTKGEPK